MQSFGKSSGLGWTGMEWNDVNGMEQSQLGEVFTSHKCCVNWHDFCSWVGQLHMLCSPLDNSRKFTSSQDCEHAVLYY